MKDAQQVAIIEVDGKQVPVTQGKIVSIDHRNIAPGENITFNNVRVLFAGTKHNIGAPYIKNATVNAEVVTQEKGRKIIVFKKKRRKGYKVKNGFRKLYTNVLIKEITTKES